MFRRRSASTGTASRIPSSSRIYCARAVSATPSQLASSACSLESRSRPEITAGDNHTCVRRTDGRVALLYVMEPADFQHWMAVEERMRDLLQHNPEARMWVAEMMSNAVEVSPDAQGRILIPAKLKEAAALFMR